MLKQLSAELLEASGDLASDDATTQTAAEESIADWFWRTAGLDEEEGKMSELNQSLLLVLAGLPPEAHRPIIGGLAEEGLVVRPAERALRSADSEAGQLVSQVEQGLRRVLQRQSVRAETFVVEREPREESEPVLKFPLLTIALDRREVFVGGRLVVLSRTEFDLLRLMAASPGRIFSRDDLVLRSRGDDYPVTSRSIDVQVVGIRKKLGEARAYVETVRGAGYRFRAPPTPEQANRQNG
jgi:DNA-binding winged helix-turn-helix (wHTH) protein